MKMQFIHWKGQLSDTHYRYNYVYISCTVLSAADKESGLTTIKLTCYIFSNLHYTEKYFSLNTNTQRFNQLRFLKL